MPGSYRRSPRPYLHDFGSQIGLRLATKRPERIAALIIQNGDIYEDALGPKYDGLKAYWRHPTEAGRAKLAEAVSEEGYQEEFLNDVRPWLTTPRRKEIAVGLIAETSLDEVVTLSRDFLERRHS